METSDLLNKEDEQILKEIQIIKQNIAKYVGAKTIVDEIRNIIKESRYFSFTSKRTEKYISLSRPLFIVSINRELVTKDTGYVFTETPNDCSIISKLIQQEITSKYSNYISSIMRGEELKKIMTKNNIDVNDDLLELTTFITSSIFGINIALNENIIYIEFAI